MREIFPGRLWLGNAADVRNARQLHDFGVEAVVDLAYEEPFAQLTRGMLYCRFPILDGAGNRTGLLLMAVETTAALIRHQTATLVGCGAGMSRSPAVAAVALAVVRRVSPEACLLELTAAHPHDISPQLWNNLRKVYNQIVGHRPGEHP
jgi:protein-tyrosine phosphatase